MGVFFSLRSGLFISCHYWWFKTQLKTRRFYLFLNSITIATVTTIKHRPVIYIYIKQNLLIQASFVHESPPRGTEWRKPNLLRLHSIVYIQRSIVVIRLIIHEMASNEHCYRVIKLIRWLC